MFFFFNDTATTEIYTLSLHDALPILVQQVLGEVLAPRGRVGHRVHLLVALAVEAGRLPVRAVGAPLLVLEVVADRKSTRLNSSHANISYAVFCLKKKKKHNLPLSQSH